MLSFIVERRPPRHVVFPGIYYKYREKWAAFSMIICVGPNELAGWHLNLLSPAKIGFIYIGGFIRPVP